MVPLRPNDDIHNNVNQAQCSMQCAYDNLVGKCVVPSSPSFADPPTHGKIASESIDRLRSKGPVMETSSFDTTDNSVNSIERSSHFNFPNKSRTKLMRSSSSAFSPPEKKSIKAVEAEEGLLTNGNPKSSKSKETDFEDDDLSEKTEKTSNNCKTPAEERKEEENGSISIVPSQVSLSYQVVPSDVYEVLNEMDAKEESESICYHDDGDDDDESKVCFDEKPAETKTLVEIEKSLPRRDDIELDTRKMSFDSRKPSIDETDTHVETRSPNLPIKSNQNDNFEEGHEADDAGDGVQLNFVLDPVTGGYIPEPTRQNLEGPRTFGDEFTDEKLVDTEGKNGVEETISSAMAREVEAEEDDNEKIYLSEALAQEQDRANDKYIPDQKAPANSLPFSHAKYTNPSILESYFAFRLETAANSREMQRNRLSTELAPLKTEYQDFRRRLQSLIKSAKAYQKANRQLEKARSECFQRCLSLLDLQKEEQRGTFPTSNSVDDITVRGHPKSLESIQQLASIQVEVLSEEFQQNILDYALEWDQGIASVIDSEAREVKKLQNNQLHYERKLTSLRRKVTGLASKDKDIPTALDEKLKRNEAKLKDVSEALLQREGKLCLMIEEVTVKGWKDLYPLVENLLKWEANRSGSQNVIYRQFPTTIALFKKRYQLTYQ